MLLIQNVESLKAYADMALLIEANKGKTRHLSSQLIVEKFKLPYKIVDKSTVDDYTSIFPFGKVPGIVEDNGYKLSESMAVTLYCK